MTFERIQVPIKANTNRTAGSGSLFPTLSTRLRKRSVKRTLPFAPGMPGVPLSAMGSPRGDSLVSSSVHSADPHRWFVPYGIGAVSGCCPPRSVDHRGPRRAEWARGQLRDVSQASSADFAAGHSSSSSENQAVSRLRPLMMKCLRKMPSNVKPRRRAALRERSFKASHFHSTRRYPSRSKAFAEHQINGLGIRHTALVVGAVPDVAQLETAVGFFDPHEADHADRKLLRVLDDRQKQGILARCSLDQPGLQHLLVLERAVGQVGPEGLDRAVAVGACEERRGVTGGVHGS